MIYGYVGVYIIYGVCVCMYVIYVCAIYISEQVIM